MIVIAHEQLHNKQIRFAEKFILWIQNTNDIKKIGGINGIFLQSEPRNMGTYQ